MMGLVTNLIRYLESDTPIIAPAASAISELMMRLRSSVKCSKKVIAPPGSSSSTTTTAGLAASSAIPGVATGATGAIAVISSGGLLGVMCGIVGGDGGGRAFLWRCNSMGIADRVFRLGDVTHAVAARF